MKNVILVALVSLAPAAFAVNDDGSLTKCEQFVVNVTLPVWEFFERPTPLNRILDTHDDYNRQVLRSDTDTFFALQRAPKDGTPRRVTLGRTRSYYTSSGDFIKFKAGTSVEFEPKSNLVLDQNAHRLAEAMGAYMTSDTSGWIERLINRIRGNKTPQSTVDITETASDEALDRLDELKITIHTETAPLQNIPGAKVSRDNQLGLTTFTTSPSLWKADSNGNLILIGPKEVVLKRSSLVSVQGIRYADHEREMFRLTGRGKFLSLIKVGDNISFFLSRLIDSEPKYEMYRGMLLGQRYVRGQIVKVLPDRFIVARPNRSLFVVPKDAIVSLKEYETDFDFTALDRAENGYRAFDKWDNDDQELYGGDTIGQNIFYFSEKSEIGPSWVFLPGGGGQAEKYGLWLRIKAFGFDIPFEHVTRANRFWSPKRD